MITFSGLSSTSGNWDRLRVVSVGFGSSLPSDPKYFSSSRKGTWRYHCYHRHYHEAKKKSWVLLPLLFRLIFFKLAPGSYLLGKQSRLSSRFVISHYGILLMRVVSIFPLFIKLRLRLFCYYDNLTGCHDGKIAKKNLLEVKFHFLPSFWRLWVFLLSLGGRRERCDRWVSSSWYWYQSLTTITVIHLEIPLLSSLLSLDFEGDDDNNHTARHTHISLSACHLSPLANLTVQPHPFRDWVLGNRALFTSPS